MINLDTKPASHLVGQILDAIDFVIGKEALSLNAYVAALEASIKASLNPPRADTPYQFVRVAAAKLGLDVLRAAYIANGNREQLASLVDGLLAARAERWWVEAMKTSPTDAVQGLVSCMSGMMRMLDEWNPAGATDADRFVGSNALGIGITLLQRCGVSRMPPSKVPVNNGSNQHNLN